MYVSKQMIVMRRDLKMRKGKIAAQAGHACVNAVMMALQRDGRLADAYVDETGIHLRGDGPVTPLSEWFEKGEAKICVYVDSEEALLAIDAQAKERGILCALICDAGMTEFHGQPTFTCLALEPLESSVADELTGELPLF